MVEKISESHTVIPVVRLCTEDGEVIEGFMLRPGYRVDITLTKEQLKKKPARLVCDGGR